MYGINEKIYERLVNYFNSRIEITKVVLFGSRAKGIAKDNADIDLCITCKEVSKGTIVYEIEEVVGIYSCDILFSDSLNKEIEKQIERDGIVIYKQA